MDELIVKYDRYRFVIKSIYYGRTQDINELFVESKDLRSSLQISLARAGLFYHLNRISVYEFDDEQNEAKITYQWSSDKKYGNKKSHFKRLMLHAYNLEIINPKTKRKMNFLCDVPKTFNDLFKED